MHEVTGESLQKVCPRCSSLAFTSGRRCPWCGGSYRRRLWPALLAVALVQAALLLGGIAYALVLAGDELDRTLDAEVRRVEGELDRSLGGIRRELDRRLPEPTATP